MSRRQEEDKEDEKEEEGEEEEEREGRDFGIDQCFSKPQWPVC